MAVKVTEVKRIEEYVYNLVGRPEVRRYTFHIRMFIYTNDGLCSCGLQKKMVQVVFATLKSADGFQHKREFRPGLNGDLKPDDDHTAQLLQLAQR